MATSHRWFILLFVILYSVTLFASKARLNAKNYAASPDGQSILFGFSISSFDIMKVNDGFKKLYVRGLYPIAEPGKPELYTIGSLIMVPAGFKFEIKILDQKVETVSDILITPYQQKNRCGPQNWAFNFDSALYGKDVVYPNDFIEVKEVGKIQSFRIVRVGVNPFRVNPVKKEMSVIRALNFEVVLKRTEWAHSNVQVSKSVFEFIRKLTINGQMAQVWSKVNFEPEKLLIVTADIYKETIQPLVDWKRRKGLLVDVITLSEAGGTKETVKQFIQNYYDKEKFTYLLFVGNKDTMPAYFESTGSGSAISDYRMALLSGSDAIPDVFYGRLLADNESEVKTQIERWINYEKSPPSGDWFFKAITIASSEGYDPSDKEYAEMVATALKSYTYQSVDPFLQGAQTATAANISNAINDGRSWISYFGHGSGTSWGSTNDTFNTSTVDKLNNQGKLPILIDVACSNASWAYITRCFGKAWVTNTSNAGAIAFYGGSVNISWDPPAVMSVGIAKYHFEKPVHSLGGSVMAGQMYLVEKMGTGNPVIDNIKWYNLFGDPSLVLRTNTPLEYTLKVQIKSGLNAYIADVVASSLDGTPVEGLLLSVTSSDGKILGVGKTDVSGHASLLLLESASISDAILTASGYNMETQEVLLQ